MTALEATGAEATNPTKMTATDYGQAPFLCEGTKFDVPSSNSSGSFYICESKADANKIAEFYEKAGDMSKRFAQRVYRNDYVGVVLQLPQVGIGDALAAKYEGAVKALSE